ncbi:MAG: outer membrane protein assembly factor BamB [Gammaproteobacteria bacterium]|jgi:outer membrane protein assembly factor BamB|nr:outer membrane protein assembly factor BamB [Gammaproteobacteria bacterium]
MSPSVRQINNDMTTGVSPRWLLVIFFLFLNQGCSLFGGDDEDESLLPAELIEFTETVDVDQQWKASVGKGHEGLGIALNPTTDGETVYAASFNGNVIAINANNGRKIWKQSFDFSFTAGPTYKDGILVLGTNNGELINIDSMTGEILWTTTVSSEILAPVAIKDDQIFVRSVDGNLTAFLSDNGSLMWTANHRVPRLSLRGTTSPEVFANAVLSGFDDGKVSAYDLVDGSLLWETMLTPPGGRTEIEKINDIDAPMTIVGNELYVGSYQGALAALALESGDIIWLTEASIYAGMAVDEDAVFVSESDGSVMALSRFTGREIWKKDNLLNRYPSAPVIIGDSIIVGDLEGYLHWLDKESGETQQRISIGKDKISSVPLVMEDTVIVQTDGGNLVSVKTFIPSS